MITRFFVCALLATTAIISGCSSTGGQLKNNSAAISKQYNNVWDRIRDGYAMPDLRDSRVDYWVDYYAKRPGSVQTMANRSSKYIYYCQFIHIIHQLFGYSRIHLACSRCLCYICRC